MKRWHEDYNHSFQQQQKNKNWSKSLDVGRFRKQHALDCGKSKCQICHSDKFPKREKTRKEELFKKSFDEQIKDWED